ncbi:MAG: cyanophycin synthetase, partial [bacterium]|nr:cyanophycin synthetase [bacterium]
LTAIGEMPVHVEFFAGPEAVAREKARLLEALPAAGFAALNYDDATVAKLKDRTRARVLTYGFGEGADIRIVNFETRSELDAPQGISFKLEYGGSYVPVRMDGMLGKAHAYAAAAGACVGLVFGVNLVKIAEGLNLFYKPMRGRMMLLPGVKESWIIDDSYNASPLAMRTALDTLREIKAKRKVAVLGDMLEIGHYTVEAHEEMGKLAAGVVNFLVTVGPRGKFIAYAAKKYGLPRRNIISFDTADEARLPVQELARKGDVILIKASRAIQLEKIVMEIELPKAVQKTVQEAQSQV